MGIQHSWCGYVCAGNVTVILKWHNPKPDPGGGGGGVWKNGALTQREREKLKEVLSSQPHRGCWQADYSASYFNAERRVGKFLGLDSTA